MNKGKSPTKSEVEEVKDKPIETDTSPVLQTVRIRATSDQLDQEGSRRRIGLTGPDVSVNIRCGLPDNKGLKIIPVPGGLYKVRNLAGGVAPAPMGGMHSELSKLQDRVLAYNQQVK